MSRQAPRRGGEQKLQMTRSTDLDDDRETSWPRLFREASGPAHANFVGHRSSLCTCMDDAAANQSGPATRMAVRPG